MGLGLDRYDPTAPVSVDPVLGYSSYLGGNSLDEAAALAVDGSGNAYLTGETYSTNFPTAGAVQGSNAGSSDAFVTKFNSSGSALVYSTYLGGNSDTEGDVGDAIALDGSGDAYVTGYASRPTSRCSTRTSTSARHPENAFVSKLNTAAARCCSAPIWAAAGWTSAMASRWTAAGTLTWQA